jgi:hypothetical protein
MVRQVLAADAVVTVHGELDLAVWLRPGTPITIASILLVVAIGDPRQSAWRSWRWLWLYLALSAVLNVQSMFVPDAPIVIANLGRFLYVPPLLFGLAVVVGNPRYRTFARIGAIVIVVQMAVGLALAGGITKAVPTIRTSITFLLVATVAAVGVLARVARVRGPILRDPPMLALVATLLAYATQSAYAPIQRVLAGSEMSMTLRWTRAVVWVVAYALWWYAFREARRQARPG